jgi:hypothetical protein
MGALYSSSMIINPHTCITRPNNPVIISVSKPRVKSVLVSHILLVNPFIFFTFGYILFNNDYFQGATTPASNWVWDSEQSNGENNQLIFTFSFSLAGYDVTTASLSGLWGIDNVGTVLLNGNLLSSLPDVVVENFNTLHAFSAGPGSSAFVSGLNVLTFDVGNRGGPGAFRASVEVTAEVSTPSVAIMFLLGLVAVASRKIYTK